MVNYLENQMMNSSHCHANWGVIACTLRQWNQDFWPLNACELSIGTEKKPTIVKASFYEFGPILPPRIRYFQRLGAKTKSNGPKKKHCFAHPFFQIKVPWRMEERKHIALQNYLFVSTQNMMHHRPYKNCSENQEQTLEIGLHIILDAWR